MLNEKEKPESRAVYTVIRVHKIAKYPYYAVPFKILFQ